MSLKKYRLAFVLISPFILFLIIFFIALILKNNAQLKYSFLWSVSDFQAYCEIKKCPLRDHFFIQDNQLKKTQVPSMSQENLYFYDVAQHQSTAMSFEKAQHLKFLNALNAPQGFKLIYALPFDRPPFPFNFDPELTYGSSMFMKPSFPVALEKNHWQLKIYDQHLSVQTTGTLGASENLKLLGWVAA